MESQWILKRSAAGCWKRAYGRASEAEDLSAEAAPESAFRGTGADGRELRKLAGRPGSARLSPAYRSDDATSTSWVDVCGRRDDVGSCRYAARLGGEVRSAAGLYVDWKNVYHHQPTARERQDGVVGVSQFGRMCAKLGIELIGAHSPQAKGRVERGHGTHQDRLIKKMRLRSIGEYEAANRFVKEIYLPQHNARYAVAPSREGRLPLPVTGANGSRSGVLSGAGTEGGQRLGGAIWQPVATDRSSTKDTGERRPHGDRTGAPRRLLDDVAGRQGSTMA